MTDSNQIDAAFASQLLAGVTPANAEQVYRALRSDLARGYNAFGKSVVSFTTLRHVADTIAERFGF